MLGVPDREKLRRLTETGQGAARAASKAAIDVAQAALREARAWDVFKWAVIGLLFCSAVGVAFGLLPAVRASRLHPIEALGHE
jgi:hypothetical protein